MLVILKATVNDQLYERNQKFEKVRNLWANERCMKQRAHWDLAGKTQFSDPESAIMRETNKSRSAELLMKEQCL